MDDVQDRSTDARAANEPARDESMVALSICFFKDGEGLSWPDSWKDSASWPPRQGMTQSEKFTHSESGMWAGQLVAMSGAGKRSLDLLQELQRALDKGRSQHQVRLKFWHVSFPPFFCCALTPFNVSGLVFKNMFVFPKQCIHTDGFLL